jgi:hypothetical protein
MRCPDAGLAPASLFPGRARGLRRGPPLPRRPTLVFVAAAVDTGGIDNDR